MIFTTVRDQPILMLMEELAYYLNKLAHEDMHKKAIMDYLHFHLPFEINLLLLYLHLKAAHELKKDLLDYQRDFYKQRPRRRCKNRDKALVFGNEKDAATAYRLSEVLVRHDIKVHRLVKIFIKTEKTFHKRIVFIVPLNQKKKKNSDWSRLFLVNKKQFKDSLFYDVSAWTFVACI